MVTQGEKKYNRKNIAETAKNEIKMWHTLIHKIDKTENERIKRVKRMRVCRLMFWNYVSYLLLLDDAVFVNDPDLIIGILEVFKSVSEFWSG